MLYSLTTNALLTYEHFLLTRIIHALLLMLYYSCFTTHALLLTLYYSCFTTHALLLTLCYSCFTTHALLLTLCACFAHALLMLYWRSRLTGTIPSCINKMTRLFKFDVRTNLLEGSIPTEFGTSRIHITYISVPSKASKEPVVCVGVCVCVCVCISA